MSNKLLITGATGYIASHVLNKLKLQNFDEIILCDRSFKLDRLQQKYDFKLKELDLSEYYEIDFSQINTIVHCAYLNDNESELKFLTQIHKDTFLVFISSAAVYGEGAGTVVNIESATRPINTYGFNKLRLENFIKAAFKNHAILRVSNPYGKEFSQKNFFSIAKNKLENNQYLTLNSEHANEIVRDFIDIDSCSEKIVKVIENQLQGIFNISSGKAQSLEEFLSANIENLDKNLIHYATKRANEIQYSVLEPNI